VFAWWLVLAALASLCAAMPVRAGGFNHQLIEQGREQFHRSCAQCHGRNMVNSGTTVYDLRRFPTDQHERFVNSVTNGKGNMPSFKGALSDEQIEALWNYVGSRAGKEP
jgi:cytochrome c6